MPREEEVLQWGVCWQGKQLVKVFDSDGREKSDYLTSDSARGPPLQDVFVLAAVACADRTDFKDIAAHQDAIAPCSACAFTLR